MKAAESLSVWLFVVSVVWKLRTALMAVLEVSLQLSLAAGLVFCASRASSLDRLWCQMSCCSVLTFVGPSLTLVQLLWSTLRLESKSKREFWSMSLPVAASKKRSLMPTTREPESVSLSRLFRLLRCRYCCLSVALFVCLLAAVRLSSQTEALLQVKTFVVRAKSLPMSGARCRRYRLRARDCR